MTYHKKIKRVIPIIKAKIDIMVKILVIIFMPFEYCRGGFWRKVKSRFNLDLKKKNPQTCEEIL